MNEKLCLFCKLFEVEQGYRYCSETFADEFVMESRNPPMKSQPIVLNP